MKARAGDRIPTAILAALLIAGGCEKTPAGRAGASARPPSPPVAGPAHTPLASALDTSRLLKDPRHVPRTRHVNPDGSPKYTNRLVLETSPYLLQHAHNPVDWHPWGDEAFEQAELEDKPVFLSVGYSTCHWCHVMERESFEDEEIARFLNENYVAIKVDREERPDVDSLYMNAVLALAGQGGWPMTVVLTPSREPFFAGTYFPARDGDRGAQRGLLSILRALRLSYSGRRDGVTSFARRLTEGLQAASRSRPPGGIPGPETIRQAVTRLAEGFDPLNGGFGGAPKFPTPSNLELLARYHKRTGDSRALHMVVLTLEKMAAGGIYDHLGGGFHRYSTDERWLVPHFEKMLYDNAQLVEAYLTGYQLTGRADFARVARETLDYVAREMSDPAGGFYSATDADSSVPGTGHDAEGMYFTWTPAEVRAVLGEERARLAGAYYGITEEGNFEGRNVLGTPVPLESLADSIRAARTALYEARSTRPPPARDEKIITSWNGLMISAFARGALVLGEPSYASRAVKAAEFLLKNMKMDGMLRRSFKDGLARHEGVLDDYAFLARGLLDLSEAAHDVRWLSEAMKLHAILDESFIDKENGGFFMTPESHKGLVARMKPGHDGAEPSGNSVAVLNLLRLGVLTRQERYRSAAERSLRAFSVSLQEGHGVPKMLCALDHYLDRPVEVVIVSSGAGAAAELESVLHRTFVPNRVFASATEGTDLKRQAKITPLLAEKRVLSGVATAFVCRGSHCELPTADSKVFAAQLGKVEPLFPDPAPRPLSELPKPKP